MLGHTGVKGHVIVLAPSTKWVEEQDWVLVAELEELLAGVVQEEDVTVVEWVSYLEGIDGVSILCCDLSLDLGWEQSVFVQTIIECYSFGKTHCSRNEPISLFDDCLCFWMVFRPSAKCP